MAVYIPDSPEDLIKKIQTHTLAPFPEWAESSIKKLRSEFRGKDADPSAPLIVTGHQPIFYHPGILAKDLLSHFLAKSARGIALNMIVDTDDEDISLHLPVRGKTGLLSRESFPISSTGIALVGQKIPAEAKENIMKRLSGYRKELYEVFVPSMVPQISEDLDSLTEIIRISEFVCEPGIRLRELWEKNHSIRLKTIYTSRIVQSESFQVFKEYIISREKEFRKIYNESLTEYRELHKIKNKAQPLPDLDEVSGELPFWVVKNGERRPFIQGSDINDINIYPRAVTLTLFCRIFISDLMIHGTGGARYDQITNRILERFFQYEAAPFSVASATLSLDVRADYAVDSRDISEIENDLRRYDFDPVYFLKKGHPLKLEKSKIIEKRKNPGADLKKIHSEIMKTNNEAKKLLGEFHRNLLKEKERSRAVYRNNMVRLDRTFPFIFYSIHPLVEKVKTYGKVKSV